MGYRSVNLVLLLVAALAVLRVQGLAHSGPEAKQEAKQDAKPLDAAAKVASPSYYGHGDGYGHGYYPDGYRNFWDSLAPSPGGPQWSCTCPLNYDVLDTANGCNTVRTCPTDYQAGDFCENVLCTCQANGGEPYEFCGSSVAAGGGGGDLCYRATCPEDGTIHIEGRVGVSSCCGGNPGTIVLFDGEYPAQPSDTGLITSTNANPTAPESIDITRPCTAGQVFTMCERGAIFLTRFTRFEFTPSQRGQVCCKAGCITTNCY